MGTESTVRPSIAPEVVDLLHLCGRALAKEPVELGRLRQMNLAQVHALAASQGLAALAYYGVEPALGKDRPQDAPLDTWRRERDASIRRQMLFSAERAQVCAWLAGNGIWHAPLKGAVLEGLYPRVGMREYCDNDILYDEARRADVARFFKGRGYRQNADGHVPDTDDAFTKEPVYQFEMSRRLFSRHSIPEAALYYQDIRSRLVSVDGSPFCLRLTDEDSYVYLVAHARKHFLVGGTGVRVLCDLRVLPASSEAGFDWEYVDRELATLGMARFGESLARLAACVFEPDFDPASLCDEDANTLFSLTAYGTYGTIEHQTELQLERERERGGSTGGYLRKRILPDDAWWEINFPFAHEHKWARPPVLVFRTLRAAFSPERRARVSAEVRALIRKVRGDSR